jgi:molybdopterin-containing oxidoreductase family molybdopterin binding subunit
LTLWREDSIDLRALSAASLSQGAMPAEQVIHTVCAHNCGGRSRLACTVRDGRLVNVEPGPMPDPRYQGLCVRCLTLPQWVYAADRIAAPMRRVGARGEGRFEAISWDVALGEIAERFSSLIDRHGASSIAFTRTSGSSPLGNYSRLAAMLGGGGSMNFFGGVDMAVHMGLNTTLGFQGMFDQCANEWTDRERADTILVWGNNAAETSMTYMKFLLDARDRGSELVVIDPRHSTTAMHASWWVAPRPGTDLALALGLLHVLLAEDWIDRDFAGKHSVAPLLVRADNGRFLRAGDLRAEASSGNAETEIFLAVDERTDLPGPADSIDRVLLEGRRRFAGIEVATALTLLRERVQAFPPERVASLTGIAAEDIHDLARLYASSPASTIAFGYGVDRYQHADVLTRAAATMAVLTGQIGRSGAGVGVQSHGIGSYPARLAGGVALPEWARTEAVPNIEVGTRPLPVRALFCQGDWLNQRQPHLSRAKEYLDSLDFVVTVDHFWQTTTRYSDIVLPASTFLEGDEPVRDAVVSGNCVMLRQPVIPPVGESRPDAEIEKALAERLGLGDWFSDSAEEIVRRQIDGSDDPAMAGVDYAALRAADGALPLRVPETPRIAYEGLRFPTRTGRAEFYVEDLVDLGEALPDFLEDHEASSTHALAELFPLVLTQAHARQRAHSTFFNTRWTLEVWPEPVLEMNPDDARARGLDDGELAEAFNERGRVVARVVCNPDYPSGLGNLSEGWKQSQYTAGNVQELTGGAINRAQTRLFGHANIPFYDTRVEVRRFEPEARA